MKPEDKAPAAKPKPNPNGRVFDVMRPGKAPASPTSRPVVIGHKKSAQRAQISVSGIGESEEKHFLNSKQKIQIKPDDAAVEPIETKAPEKPAPPAPTQKVAVTASGEEEKPSVVPVEKPEPVTPPVAAKPEPVEEAPAPEPAHSEPEAASAEPPTLDEQLAAAEPQEPERPATPKVSAADLPADTAPVEPDLSEEGAGKVVVSRHGSMMESMLVPMLILLVVVLAVAAVDIAIDAGLIKTNAVPHTNFF